MAAEHVPAGAGLDAARERLAEVADVEHRDAAAGQRPQRAEGAYHALHEGVQVRLFGAADPARVDDRDGRPAVLEAAHVALGRDLGTAVAGAGRGERPGRGDHRGGRRDEHADRRHVHHPGQSGRHGLADDVAGAAHVGLDQVAGRAGDAERGGGVDRGVASVERGGDGRGVEHVAGDQLDLLGRDADGGEGLGGPAGIADQGARPVPGGEQGADGGGPDEAGRAGEEDPHEIKLALGMEFRNRTGPAQRIRPLGPSRCRSGRTAGGVSVILILPGPMTGR